MCYILSLNSLLMDRNIPQYLGIGRQMKTVSAKQGCILGSQFRSCCVCSLDFSTNTQELLMKYKMTLSSRFPAKDREGKESEMIGGEGSD